MSFILTGCSVLLAYEACYVQRLAILVLYALSAGAVEYADYISAAG